MQGFLSSIEPQKDFFLMPTLLKVWVPAGKLVPDISTEVASPQEYRPLPMNSKPHLPPFGSSFRKLSQSACGIVMLTVSTLSSA